MKGNNGVRFFAIIIIIGILTWIAWNGELLGYKIPGARDITLGIDVKGGVDATLTGEHKDGSAPTTDEMDTAKKIISIRLDNDGITDKVITSDNTTHRIIVQIPWKSNEKDFNPQATIDKAVKTAILTFREADETKKDAKGDYLPLEDKIILEGSKDIKGASPQISSTGGTDVKLELTDSGIKKFAEATARLIGKPIVIFMDNTFISDPIVNVAIPDGQAIIQLKGDAKSQQTEAKSLADTIRSGALPFKLSIMSVNSISPQLGMNALNTMYQAGLVALLLVCLFMLFYYRLPGVIACVALIGHTTIQLLMISWMHVTNLTLPGLAGIVLTIGMGVDANIIIFERIKEELRNGKTLRAAIDVGFQRAFSAIFDANMTTLIAAVVLWVFGTGTLKGFAYTLGLGVVLSFLTAVLVSRLLLKSAADLNIAKHRWLYGVKEVTK